MTTPNTAQTPTPWTDKWLMRAHQRGCDSIDIDDCRTLERHLRRIVEAWEKHELSGYVQHFGELGDAIQAAKEEIK